MCPTSANASFLAFSVLIKSILQRFPADFCECVFDWSKRIAARRRGLWWPFFPVTNRDQNQARHRLV